MRTTLTTFPVRTLSEIEKKDSLIASVDSIFKNFSSMVSKISEFDSDLDLELTKIEKETEKFYSSLGEVKEKLLVNL